MYLIMITKIINSFSTTLSSLNKFPKAYVACQNGLFFLVNDKKSKNFDTSHIAQFAKDHFQVICKSNANSYSERIKMLGDMKTGLVAYKDRLYSSKKWYQKIADFFGFKSYQEKNIDSVISKIDKEASLFRAKIKGAQEILKASQGSAKQNLCTPETILKHFYHSALDSSPLKIQSLQGASQASAIHWYINHLKEFQSTLSSPGDAADLDAFIKQLHFAADLSCLQNAYFDLHYYDRSHSEGFTYMVGSTTFKIPKEGVSCLKEMIIHTILEKLKSLKNGERLLLPGGYRTSDKGHSVLFSIQKESQNNFTFQIINTGEGINPIGMTAGQRMVVKDVVYSQISERQLSYEFFSGLIQKSLQIEDPDPTYFIYNSICNYFNGPQQMKRIYEFISKSLGDKHLSVIGREHKAQRKGSCSVKSITSAAKTFLPKRLYLNFKAWMTQREIHLITHLHRGSYFSKVVSSSQVDTLLAEAAKILQKRQWKASQA